MEKRGLLAFVILVIAAFASFTAIAAGGLSLSPPLGFLTAFVVALALYLVWEFWGKKPLNPKTESAA